MSLSPLCPDGERVTLSVDTYGDDDRLPPGCVRIDVLYQTSGALSRLRRQEVSDALFVILRDAILAERRREAEECPAPPLPPPLPLVTEAMTGGDPFAGKRTHEKLRRVLSLVPIMRPGGDL